MAAAATPISLAEYLNTDYEPDCDYVDAVLEERNVGKNRHSRTQILLAHWLLAREQEHAFKAMTEQRVQLSPSRVRIPDICLLNKGDVDEITQTPPLLWVEVLSPDDRWSRVQIRLRDVLAAGVPMIWIIDPYGNQAWFATKEKGVVEAEDGILRCANPPLTLPIADVLPD